MQKKVDQYSLFERVLEHMLKRHGLEVFVKEFKFHPVRKWKVDYAFPKARLFVEIEGGFWSGGRHGRGCGAIKDMEKYNEAAIMGYHLLRFTPQQTASMHAANTILRWFEERNKREAQ